MKNLIYFVLLSLLPFVALAQTPQPTPEPEPALVVELVWGDPVTYKDDSALDPADISHHNLYIAGAPGPVKVTPGGEYDFTPPEGVTTLTLSMETVLFDKRVSSLVFAPDLYIGDPNGVRNFTVRIRRN